MFWKVTIAQFALIKILNSEFKEEWTAFDNEKW